MTKRRGYREPVVQPQDESIRHIPLTQGKFAVVDVEDYEWLMRHRWYAYWNNITKSFYAGRNTPYERGKKRSIIRMHREILGLSEDDPRLADHIKSGDTLNNRRSNLRIATPSQNRINSRLRSDSKSGHIGVSQHSDKKGWIAYIMKEGKVYKRKYFGTKDAAIEARKSWEKECFGEFSPHQH